MPQTYLPTRLAALLSLIFILYVGFIFSAHQEGFERAQRGEKPMFTDFTSTYGASILLNEGPVENVYHPQLIRQANARAGNLAYGNTLTPEQSRVGLSPFMYPPTFIPLIMPLASLSYFSAMIAWLALTAIPYLLAVRSAMHGAPLGFFVALASPPTFFNLMFGQTSFLPAGLIGLGIALLDRRPWLAGALIGLATIKPHLGILIPFALAAGGYWKPFFAAAITTLVLIFTSLISFGDEPWFAFIGISIFYLEGFQYNAYALKFMPSIFSLSQLSGASLPVAGLLQSLATLCCMAMVAHVWGQSRGRSDLDELKRAVLLLAIPLATPMVFVYDLVVIVPGLAYLIQHLRATGGRPWHWVIVVGAPALLLLLKPLGATPGIHLAVLALFAPLSLAVAFWRKGLASS